MRNRKLFSPSNEFSHLVSYIILVGWTLLILIKLIGQNNYTVTAGGR